MTVRRFRVVLALGVALLALSGAPWGAAPGALSDASLSSAAAGVHRDGGGKASPTKKGGQGGEKAAPKGSWEAQVLDVLDGDTVEVDYHGQRLRIRFFGVDAPEKEQAGGQDAKAFSTELLLGRIVSVEVTSGDMHGRTVGIIHIGETIANEELVRNGWAWVYRTYCKRDDPCRRWFRLEDEARDAGRGLWQADNPTPPWDWRYVHRTVPPFAPRHPERQGDDPAPAGPDDPAPAPAGPAPRPVPGKDAPAR